jgi:hypothetical protein
MPNSTQTAGSGSGVGWTSPGNITGIGYATDNLGAGATSGPLVGLNFGFAIPAGSTINGVIASASAFAGQGFALEFFDIQLMLSGVVIGTAKSDTTKWRASPKVFSYGSPTDLWGATLTPTNINDPTFGFQTGVENVAAESVLASVASYGLQVYYTFGGGGGGGIPGQSNGGMSNPLNMLLIPGNVGFNFSFYTLDPTNFNDPNSGSFYNWKVEDVIEGRTPTVSRVILSYRDLGVATITVTLSGVVGMTDALQPDTPKSATATIQIGTANATGKLCTVVLGMNFTAANLQLSVQRAANAGPVSITKARLEGRVETTVY